MGDRANIKIPMKACNGEPAGNVFLYGHWSGEEMPQVLQNGLRAGRGRWDDDTYLARIIAREMGMGESGETGFGIGSYPADNEHPFLVVDVERQIVRVECPQDDGEISKIIRKYHSDDTVSGKKEWTFEEYVAIEDPKWVRPKDE